jgi:hypothetical protein
MKEESCAALGLFHPAQEIGIHLAPVNQKVNVVRHHAVGVEQKSQLDSFLQQNGQDRLGDVSVGKVGAAVIAADGGEIDVMA